MKGKGFPTNHIKQTIVSNPILQHHVSRSTHTVAKVSNYFPLCTNGEWITAVTKTGKNLITNVNDVLKESKKDLQQKGTNSNQFAPQLKRHLSDEGKKLVAKALHNTSRWK